MKLNVSFSRSLFTGKEIGLIIYQFHSVKKKDNCLIYIQIVLKGQLLLSSWHQKC